MSTVGISIGNENSYVAFARSGGIETIANEYSQRCTPSYVSFKDNGRQMGVAAKDNQIINLKDTFFCFKRLLKIKFKEPTFHCEKTYLPYNIYELENGECAVKVNFGKDEMIFSMQQITAMMFTKLKNIAENFLQGTVTDCVLGVPVYFTMAERRAYLEAAMIAGLKPLTLINELTAVAFYYGFYKMNVKETHTYRNVVFIDLGYTSLQVCVCNFNKGQPTILANVWDKCLGGRNFDTALLLYFSDYFEKTFKMEVNNSPKATTRLFRECEKIKKQMSTNSHNIPLHIECLIDDMDFNAQINRAQFEKLILTYIENMEAVLHQALRESRLQIGNIHSVELIGGSTRVPIIRNTVKKFYRRDPQTTLIQDEAVVQGCALMAAMYSPTIKVRRYSITEIQPYTINMHWRLKNGEDGLVELFEKNSSLPQSKLFSFKTNEPFLLELFYKDFNRGQHKALITFQGNDFSKIKNNNPIVTIKVQADRNGFISAEGRVFASLIDEEYNDLLYPRNALKNIETTNSDGEEAKTEDKFRDGLEFALDTFITLLSKKEMEKLIQLEIIMIENDNLKKEKADIKNALETYVYELKDKMNHRLNDYLSTKEKQTLESKLTEVEKWFYQEGDEKSKEEYKNKLEELKGNAYLANKRMQEHEDRKAYIEELDDILNTAANFIDNYIKNKKLSDSKSEQVKIVKKWVEDKGNWLQQIITSLSKVKLHEDPLVLASEIQQELDYFEKFIRPILNTMNSNPEETSDEEKEAPKITQEGDES